MKHLLVILMTLAGITSVIPANSQGPVIKVGAILSSTGGGGGGGGASYTVTRTWRMNLGTSFAVAPTSPPYWNVIGIDATAIQTNNNYTSPALVTDNNSNTTATLSLGNAFGSSEESAPTPATVNSGLYQDVVERSGLINLNCTTCSSTIDPTLYFSNLDPTKFYNVYCYGNSESWRASQSYWYVGATQSATISTGNNFGLSTDNEFTATYVGRIKNVQSDGTGKLTVGMHNISVNGALWNSIVLVESNVANPN